MNPVQQKISCVYVTGVLDEPSHKRQNQTFRVAATKEVNSRAIEDGVSFAKATEKIDGTCCLVTEFEGKPWLWARHDRKPSKVGEKRFGQYRKAKSNLDKEEREEGPTRFEWDPKKDFKEVPEHWMPALGLKIKNGVAMPDDLGHTPGWVPVQTQHRHHCWHLETVDLVNGLALVLREAVPSLESETGVVLEVVPLSSLVGHTCELIGTNINGNPYGLGSKKHPFHVLVPHGSLTLRCPDPSDYDRMWEWMASDIPDNKVEGVVWHCGNGTIYKLHKHHLNLSWPLQETRLTQRPVTVLVEEPPPCPSLFAQLSTLSGRLFNSVRAVCDTLAGTRDDS